MDQNKIQKYEKARDGTEYNQHIGPTLKNQEKKYYFLNIFNCEEATKKEKSKTKFCSCKREVEKKHAKKVT